MWDSVCEGFVWIGQSMLCCDNCGWPWFLHAGDLKSASIFGGETHVVPFPEAQQAQIPDMLAAWEANALWQAESEHSAAFLAAAVMLLLCESNWEGHLQ